MEWLEVAMQVFECEIQAAQLTKNALGISFEELCTAIDDCKGDVVLTGMGKSGHICRKIVATMQSLGIKAQFLHSAEALHGDLGMLAKEDIVIALSNSGETSEILGILPTIKKLGISIYGIVGRAGSTLEKYSKACVLLPPISEAYLDNVVPTSSTTAMLVVGDALAVAVAKKRGFTKNDFGEFHPSGLLGKRLTLQVQDLMLCGEDNAVVQTGATVGDAIFEMCKKPIGGVNIVSGNGKLMGIFTDGDLRRLHKRTSGAMDFLCIDKVMTQKPVTLLKEQLITQVVLDAKEHNHMMSFYPVVENGKLVGTLRMQDISKSGLL